jgi:hypothetical protein
LRRVLLSDEKKAEMKKKGKKKIEIENHDVKGNQVSWLEMERGRKKVPMSRAICSSAGNGRVFPEDRYRN